jgi:YD repeat-containing protein
MDFKMSLKKFLAVIIFLSSFNVFADTYPAVYVDSWQAGNTEYFSQSAACAAFNNGTTLSSGINTNVVGTFPRGCITTSCFTGGCSTGASSNILYYYHVATCPGGGYVSGTSCINAPICSPAQVRSSTTGICGLPPKSNGSSSSSNGCNKIDFGNPINASTGNKWQHETDFPGNTFGLIFDRYYNASTTANTSNLGSGWSHTYARSIAVQSTGTLVTIRRNDGKEYNFSQSAGVWVADADVSDHLEELKDSASVRIGWRYTTADNSVESYNVTGQLTSITDRSGLTQTHTYSDASTPVAIAPTTGLLIRVTDTFGRQLNFTYDSSSRISTLTDPAGGSYKYAYDANNNLASVTYPDANSKTYLYENTGFPHALTGITDENGLRYATFTYDTQGRATSTEHAGGVERVSLVYNADGSTTVTDALNTPRTYNFQTILGVVKSAGQSQPGGSGCGASASALTYDTNGNVASRIDFNGHMATYSYDLTRNLETSRTEGLTATGTSTPEIRTITTQWHPTFRLPTTITETGLVTNYSYDGHANITQKSLTDTVSNKNRTWNTTYTYDTNGILLQTVEDGPRTDVSDLTTYDYYLANSTCSDGSFGCRGQLKQVTTALNHVTQVTGYNANGQPTSVTDPNGLVLAMVYDLRQRLTSLTVGSEQTTYTYDSAGQLTKVTQPNGAYLTYTYDNAHRLTGIKNQLGNTRTYTLDNMGNRIKEDLTDPNGQLARSQTRVYDALSRLQNLVLPQ